MAQPTTAPIRNVLLQSGERVPLADLYRDRPLALIFLRHLGCMFCKEQVAQLREKPDLNIAFVCLAGPEDALAFQSNMNSPHPMICEPEGDLYREFGLGEGKLVQLLGPRVILKGAQATLRGFTNGRPRGNPKMLGGAFVLDKHGLIVWSHTANDAADIVSAAQVAAALQEAWSS